MINLGRDICGNLEVSSRKEWLETNGLGGYACGTVAGMHTRSYHTHLTASLEPPLHRVSMLSQLEEYVLYGGQKYYISTNHYRDTISPKGYLNLEEFRLDPFPIFTYRLADQLLEKRVFMSYGHNLTWIVYRLLTPTEEELILSVRPLFNFRDHHLRRRERCFANTHHDLENHVIRLLPDRNIIPLNIYHNAVNYEHSASWYQNLFYREEKKRGLECEEDLFSPGVISFRLETMESNFLAATTESLENPEPEAAANAEIIRRRELCSAAAPDDQFGQNLMLAADQFLVKRGEGMSVIAGYPWLGDCGRDAMMALPGLTLVTHRKNEAQALLKTYAGYCSEGMLPNHFTEDQSKPLYNTVDAALWFFIAIYRYRQATDDTAFIRKNLWPVMEEIIDYYIKGTRYHIRMDDDGLINMPEEGAQLTWMDAQVGDWVVTPRSGKPVEVNALWYNALCLMRDLCAVQPPGQKISGRLPGGFLE
jgi:predicted glycogen debranching enzyme